jgi:hypothetical protein
LRLTVSLDENMATGHESGAAMACTSRTCTSRAKSHHSRSACRRFVNSMISFSNDWAVYFIGSIAVTMLMLVLAFVQKWRAKRDVPTEA